MPQIINTNIMSLNSQRNLNTSQTDLQVSLQRLSSGLRINSAKDDAAGLAISERFTTQIRGLNQAVRNANDGISLAQTAEGALAELNNNLQRIRELAVQSANATNSPADRAALDQEVQQRIAEIDRIAAQTSFNGQKILDGTFGNAAFQVGANVGETITLDLNASMRQTNIGAVATATSVDLSTLMTEPSAVVANSSTPSGPVGLILSALAGQGFLFEVAGVEIMNVTSPGFDTITAGELDAALTAKRSELAGVGITYSGSFATGNVIFSDTSGNPFDITIHSTYGIYTEFTGADFVRGTNTVDNGVPANPLVLGVNELSIQIGNADAVAVAAGTYHTMQSLVDAVNVALGGNATAILDTSTSTVSVVSAENVVIAADAQSVFSAASFTVSGSLASVNVLSVANANDAIFRIDSALTAVSSLRSTFGAIQNRFESTIANLSTTVENLTASRSRIQDTDFAAETANLTRAQILQQAGVAMLAQANQLPQGVLSLLR